MWTCQVRMLASTALRWCQSTSGHCSAPHRTVRTFHSLVSKYFRTLFGFGPDEIGSAGAACLWLVSEYYQTLSTTTSDGHSSSFTGVRVRPDASRRRTGREGRLERAPAVLSLVSEYFRTLLGAKADGRADGEGIDSAFTGVRVLQDTVYRQLLGERGCWRRKRPLLSLLSKYFQALSRARVKTKPLLRTDDGSLVSTEKGPLAFWTLGQANIR